MYEKIGSIFHLLCSLLSLLAIVILSTRTIEEYSVLALCVVSWGFVVFTDIFICDILEKRNSANILKISVYSINIIFSSLIISFSVFFTYILIGITNSYWPLLFNIISISGILYGWLNKSSLPILKMGRIKNE